MATRACHEPSQPQPPSPLSESAAAPTHRSHRHHAATGDRRSATAGFSFAAAGWLQVYHFGVAKALQDCGVASDRSIRYAGSSAGALASTALILDMNFGAVRDYAIDCVNDCRGKWNGAFLIRGYVREGIRRFATSAFAAHLEAAAEVAKRKRVEAGQRTRKAVAVHHGLRRGRDDDMATPSDDKVAGEAERHKSDSSSSSSSCDSDDPTEDFEDSSSPSVGSAAHNETGRPAAHREEDRNIDGASRSGVPSAEPSSQRGERPSTGHHSPPATPPVCYREALNQRLEVYVSVLPWCRPKCMRTFHSVDDLEEALLASCCLTPLAGMPFQLRETGEWVCDGGLTAFQPRHDDPTYITVSPFYFTTADIKPKVFLPVWYGLYPPDPATYQAIYDLGFNDALEYLIQTHRISRHHLLKHRRHAYGNIKGRDALQEYHHAEARRERHRVKREQSRRARTWLWQLVAGFIPDALTHTRDLATAIVRDAVLGLLFLFVFRPMTIVAIYCEMLVVTAIATALAAWHSFASIVAAAWIFWLRSPPPWVARARPSQASASSQQTKRAATAAQNGSSDDGAPFAEGATTMTPPASSSFTSASRQPSGRPPVDREGPYYSDSYVTMVAELPSFVAARRRWTEAYLSMRNLVSARTPLHLWLGGHFPANLKRMERFSTLYRVVKPWIE